MHYLPAYFFYVYLIVIWEGYGYNTKWKQKEKNQNKRTNKQTKKHQPKKTPSRNSYTKLFILLGMLEIIQAYIQANPLFLMYILLIIMNWHTEFLMKFTLE